MEKAMGQVETKAGMLQLGRDLLEPGTKRLTTHDDFQHSSDAIPHADGNFTDQNGKTWAADIDLINMQVDVSKMDDQWVLKTNDRLFRNMSRAERELLQMVFSKEFNWVQIAAMRDCNTSTVRKQYNEIMQYLSGHVGRELMARLFLFYGDDYEPGQASSSIPPGQSVGGRSRRRTLPAGVFSADRPEYLGGRRPFSAGQRRVAGDR
jgi:hypothetical protein